MGGKCESDKGKPVGCKLIQKMSSDIQKIKEIRHPFSGWSILIVAVLVVIIAGFLLASTFKSNSYPTEIRLDVRVDGGGAVSEKAKANIKLELSEALLAMEARAAAAYNEKFATLLTILTIFGIAWPVIIALLQFKFSEKELEKIEKAQGIASNSLKQTAEQRKEILSLLDSTKNDFSGLRNDVYCKMSGVMAQVHSAMKEKEDKLYCSFVAFVFAYHGNAKKIDEILEATYEEFKNLREWKNKEKQQQVTTTIKNFLEFGKVDNETREVIQEMLNIAENASVK